MPVGEWQSRDFYLCVHARKNSYNLSAKGSGKVPVHSHRIMCGQRDQCRHQRPTAFTCLQSLVHRCRSSYCLGYPFSQHTLLALKFLGVKIFIIFPFNIMPCSPLLYPHHLQISSISSSYRSLLVLWVVLSRLVVVWNLD